jgi:hypothetical protein
MPRKIFTSKGKFTMRYFIISLGMLMLWPIGLYATTYGDAFTPNELRCNGDSCSLSDWSTPYKFRTYDGNWSRRIVLPRTTQPMTVDIASDASYTSSIRNSPADAASMALSFTFGAFNMYSDIALHTKDRYIFNIYVASNGFAWNPVGDSVYYMQPNRNGSYIPNSNRMVIFQMFDGDWSSKIYLPDQPLDDQLVIIHSEATYSSELRSSPNGPAITGISRGQTLIYKYYDGSWNAPDRRGIVLSGAARPNERAATLSGIIDIKLDMSIHISRPHGRTRRPDIRNRHTEFARSIAHQGVDCIVRTAGADYFAAVVRQTKGDAGSCVGAGIRLEVIRLVGIRMSDKGEARVCCRRIAVFNLKNNPDRFRG